MTKEQVFNELIIFAINTHMSGRSYSNSTPDPTVLEFCKLPLKDLAPFWTRCSDQTKLFIMKGHEQELLNWINSND
jgi:hypothetical protein